MSSTAITFALLHWTNIWMRSRNSSNGSMIMQFFVGSSYRIHEHIDPFLSCVMPSIDWCGRSRLCVFEIERHEAASELPASSMRLHAAFTCVCVIAGPKDRRMAPCDCHSGRPIASSTYDATSAEPQAEPEETRRSAASKRSMISFEANPSTAKLMVVGTELLIGVLSTIFGNAFVSESMNARRNWISWSCVRNVLFCFVMYSSRIAPSAATPGRFSVPDRRPCSCPPPAISGVSGAALFAMSMPMPFGAYTLWPLSAT